jgi:hypothetical protein
MFKGFTRNLVKRGSISLYNCFLWYFPFLAIPLCSWIFLFSLIFLFLNSNSHCYRQWPSYNHIITLWFPMLIAQPDTLTYAQTIVTQWAKFCGNSLNLCNHSSIPYTSLRSWSFFLSYFANFTLHWYSHFLINSVLVPFHLYQFSPVYSRNP